MVASWTTSPLLGVVVIVVKVVLVVVLGVVVVLVLVLGLELVLVLVIVVVLVIGLGVVLELVLLWVLVVVVVLVLVLMLALLLVVVSKLSRWSVSLFGPALSGSLLGSNSDGSTGSGDVITTAGVCVVGSTFVFGSSGIGSMNGISECGFRTGVVDSVLCTTVAVADNIGASVVGNV